MVEAADLLETGDEGVEKSGQLWHRMDSSFRQPRAHVRMVLATPVVGEGGAEALENANIMADILRKV